MKHTWFDKHGDEDELRILTRGKTGGGTVHAPILPVSSVQRARTEGGGEGTIEITREVLQQIVDNFEAFPGPVPIGVSPHEGFNERGGPALGFIDSVELVGDTLFAIMTLTSFLFEQVEAGLWRGFSVEMLEDPKFATAELKGFVITGGVFTNRPALDVNFKLPDAVAASAVCVYESFTTGDPDQGAKKESTMDKTKQELALAEAKANSAEASLEAANVKVTAGETRVAELAAAAKAAEGDNLKLKAENAQLLADASAKEASANSASDDLATVRTELATSKQETAKLEASVVGRQVIERIEWATDPDKGKGLDPVMFDGADVKDPASCFKWLAEHYSGSIDSLDHFLKHCPSGRVNKSQVSAGQPNSGTTVADINEELTDDERERLAKVVKNPAYGMFRSESQLAQYLKDNPKS